MARFPQAFVDEVRAAADIVTVVQDTVPLRRVGNRYTGLCPFHDEKTPSFGVDREKGFFHCFGCNTGGDVIKFVELNEKVGFLEAVKSLAHRFGIPVPIQPATPDEAAADAERESLLKMHEDAAAWFQEQLRGAAGTRARQALSARGVSPETIERLGIGFAPASREALKLRLLGRGFSPAQVIASGLVSRRDDGSTYDRFRNRLIIPICRESGTVIAFGGRAMEADQVPKYLNSPETPIYSKGRTLYGLHLTKQAVRQQGRVVLVEGYFDFAQVWQAGVGPVVATCGTALTPAQVRTLRRFANRAVLSFDPDAAGQGAAARSCDLLVTEGFDVTVALLPGGGDPDTFIRTRGGTEYQSLLDRAPGWLDYLAERSAARHDLERPAGRRAFLQEMLEVAARIPDPAARDQFADSIAHRARITEEVVRAEIRKAAVTRRTSLPAAQWMPGATELKPAERDLLVGIVQQPAEFVPALAELDEADLDGLRSAAILKAAKALRVDSAAAVPSALFERLNEEEGRLLTSLAVGGREPAPASDCVRALRAIRFERERSDLQREIDRLQELGGTAHAAQIAVLWQRKKELMLRLEALTG